MKLYQRLQMTSMPGWVLLPLRLFLGVTFIYAGLQKLTDPQYFNPAARGYIGRQIISFANGSPLHGFLMQFVVPHSHLFGVMIAYGEVAIGLGTLVGFLLRPAAFFGALLSLTFFLTASWHVFPYFYGSDIVFFFCWVTLLLNGPVNTGLPALDIVFAAWVLQEVSPERQIAVARLMNRLLGTGDLAQRAPAVSQVSQAPAGRQAVAPRGKQAMMRRTQQQKMRRSFIMGLVTGGAAMLGISLLGYTFLRRGGDDQGVLPRTGGETGTATAQGTPAAGSTASSGTPGTSTVIAKVSDVAANSAVTFTIASSGDPGVLVHLNNGQFVAYDALCTHAGCQVDYDPSSQMLVCPCHGAAFDPAKSAAVVQGPAPTPLSGVTIHIDSATGNITSN